MLESFAGLWPYLIMILLMVALFIFPMRSQKKQERAINEMRNNLQVGDEITTIGGVIGKIVSIKEETITIETSHDRSKIRFHKWAVKSVDVHAEDAQD